MKSHANPTLIGIFTLVGLAMAVAAILLLSANSLFNTTHTLQLYFDKSANGLQVGSDVRFGGVRVGSVRSIGVMIDPEQNRKIIPVVVSLNARDLGQTGNEEDGGIDFSSHEGIAKAVQRGLRAGMKQQSLVTGQLYVEFDVLPGAQGFTFKPEQPSEYPVVPTIGTELDELIAGIGDGIRKFNALDLESVITDLRELIGNTHERIDAIDSEAINRNLVAITENVSRMTADERISNAIDNLNTTLANLEQLTTQANDEIGPLVRDASGVLRSGREILEKSKESLATLQTTVNDLSGIANPRGPVLMRLQQALHDAERATRALQELSNDLKRNPQSILTGKAESE